MDYVKMISLILEVNDGPENWGFHANLDDT